MRNCTKLFGTGRYFT